ncbi:hypothetical protein BU26DRAFT_605315 [Trematosphaeria pertusa]|uniref:Uncharacterized protein n=1 Tax=Trematosphaeria pertusa TaxID=390896 RepID=A0A6A6IIX5_9PLEO|nr:uncharacterized protein BU26DRAFT_605315 [Trematosphaeria pertusa]KAF2249503.1 hypothetical protein BU26DRAFT_605315 [Trematosphaeria pertusa]
MAFHSRLANGSETTSEPSRRQRVPNEILFQIIGDALTLETPRPIDVKRFGVLISTKGRLNRFLRISPALQSAVLEAFYKNNSFCITTNMRFTEGRWTSQYALPPPNVCRHLRRLKFRWTISSIHYFPCQAVPPRNIKSANELLISSPAAWVLGLLTHPDHGFAQLTHLELCLEIDIGTPPGYELSEDFLEALRQARIIIKAGKIDFKVKEDYRLALESVIELVETDAKGSA